MSSEYSKTGVDVHKKGIKSFQRILNNIFPGAFCVVTPDPDLPGYGLIHHSDDVGSKILTHYLQYKETGDPNYFFPIAQDLVAMNINDTDCLDSKALSFNDTILINRFKVPKEEFLEHLTYGFEDSLRTLRNHGINLDFGGGETSDQIDQVRTISLTGSIVSRVKLDDAITGKNIEEGNHIVGLRSGGKSNYEKKKNSGIMCNGLTLARHCLTHESYETKYPEIRDPEGMPYNGKFKLDQYLEDLNMTLGEALTPPTRLYSPINKKNLEKHKEDVVGIVHNTGEGQTKILRLGKNIHYHKSMPQEPDPIFSLIQKESGESWRNMFKDFNMGTGIEYIVRNVETADSIKDISKSFGVEAKLIGFTKKNDGSNKLTIYSKFGKFQYP